MAPQYPFVSLVFLFIQFASMISSIHPTEDKIDFVAATTDELVDFMSYRSQVHDVYSNGYVIRLTRMINPLANKRHVKRTILFTHGFLQDAVEFLSFAQFVKPQKPTNECYSPNIFANLSIDNNDGLFNLGEGVLNIFRPHHLGSRPDSLKTLKRLCLPCLFSDNNYDVWLMDERGTSPGSLQITDRSLLLEERYWNFNLDDSALIDLPHVIDYIRFASGRNKISYAGFSKGNVVMFMLLAHFPHYANKIEAFVAMAPAAYGTTIRGSSNVYSFLIPIFRVINEPYVTYKVSNLLNTISAKFCSLPILEGVCRAVWDSALGLDTHNLNIWTEVLLAHSFKPQSLKTFAHLLQLVYGDAFLRFDCGSAAGNSRLYGHELPPQYDLSRITHKKIILVHSEGNDFFSTKKGSKRIAELLTVPLFEDIVLPRYYNHLSQLLSRHAFKDVFVPILRTVNRAYLAREEESNSNLIEQNLIE